MVNGIPIKLTTPDKDGNFLQRLAEANIQTIIIVGNDDSAARLGFADGREHV